MFIARSSRHIETVRFSEACRPYAMRQYDGWRSTLAVNGFSISVFKYFCEYLLVDFLNNDIYPFD